MIEAVLFDFGQTLADSADGFRVAEKEAEQKIFHDLGLSSWDDFLDKYRQVRRAHHRRSDFSRFSTWQEIYLVHGRRPPVGLLQEWERQYWSRVEEHTRLFPEAVTVLERLARDYALGLVSNTQGEIGADRHRIHRFPRLASLFQCIVIAGEDGVPPKPDPAPFLICLEKMGLKPQAAAYLGDDWRIDIQGARQVGLWPVWLKHRSVRRNWPPGDDTVPVIDNLEPLVAPGFWDPARWKS